MASDQTPRQVIAAALASEQDPWVARDVDLALDAAGFAIVARDINARLREYQEGLAEIEAILADGLGYRHHDDYGWDVGDHTPVSLALEAKSRLLVRKPTSGDGRSVPTNRWPGIPAETWETLEAAGWQLVRKPTDDRVTAAWTAFRDHPSEDGPTAMAAALAAAAAADGKSPCPTCSSPDKDVAAIEARLDGVHERFEKVDVAGICDGKVRYRLLTAKLIVDDIPAMAADIAALLAEVKQLRAVVSPRKAEAISSLVASATRLVQIERDDARATLDRVREACDRMVLPHHETGEPTGPHLQPAADMIRAALDEEATDG